MATTQIPDGAAFGLLTALDRAVAIPARDSVPHLDATWSRLVQESLTLVHEFSDVRYEAVFDRRYREGLPAAKAQALFGKLTERFGRCRLGKPLAEYHPILRAAPLACERGGPAAVEAAIVHDHLVAFRITPLERAQERIEEFLARSHRDACEDQRLGEATKAER